MAGQKRGWRAVDERAGRLHAIGADQPHGESTEAGEVDVVRVDLGRDASQERLFGHVLAVGDVIGPGVSAMARRLLPGCTAALQARITGQR